MVESLSECVGILIMLSTQMNKYKVIIKEKKTIRRDLLFSPNFSHRLARFTLSLIETSLWYGDPYHF